MAKSRPKENEERMERIINAWENLASDKSFGGMDLNQMKEAAQPARDARDEIDDLEDKLAAAMVKRDQADEAVARKLQQVVNGVLADPDFGKDSALYEAMGYTRASERKSGLTQKKKTPPKTE
jgi:hypothetical protein